MVILNSRDFYLLQHYSFTTLKLVYSTESDLVLVSWSALAFCSLDHPLPNLVAFQSHQQSGKWLGVPSSLLLIGLNWCC